MNAIILILLIPATGAMVLVFVSNPGYGAWINILVSATGLLASVNLVWMVLSHGAIHGDQLYVDAFNVYLIALTSLVGLTTSIFSRPYMAHELEIHKVTPMRLRLYHASFQGFLTLLRHHGQ